MIPRVLLAANTSKALAKLNRLVADIEVEIDSARGRRQLLERLWPGSADLIIVGRSVLAKNPAELLIQVRNVPDPPTIVVMTNLDDGVDRAELLANGCTEVISEGVPTPLLKDAIAAVVSRVRSERLQHMTRTEPRTTPRLHNLVTKSPTMQAFVEMVRRVAPSDTSLLVTGETGVGKEWIARAIHAEGSRSKGPFVSVNCGALPESLLESELFGHVEGAFTGANRTRRGVFELAHHGTIFLDEIGEMPIHLQVKLLNVLQSREIQRVGGERTVPIDVRVIAATNRDLEEDIAAGVFRRDLYYRLSVVTLTVPPLRDRREDVPELVESYLDHFRGQFPQQVEGVESAALQALASYEWPGNVRELINVIERAMLLCEGDLISVADLPPTVSPSPHAPAQILDFSFVSIPDEWLELPLRELRARVFGDLERAYLSGILNATRGNVGETARRAGLDPRSLYEKMRRLGLRKEDFRPTRRR